LWENLLRAFALGKDDIQILFPEKSRLVKTESPTNKSPSLLQGGAVNYLKKAVLIQLKAWVILEKLNYHYHNYEHKVN